MHTISKSPGLCSGPRWGSFQRSPDSLSGFRRRAPGKGTGEWVENWGSEGREIVEGGRKERGDIRKGRRGDCSMGSRWSEGRRPPVGGLSPSFKGGWKALTRIYKNGSEIRGPYPQKHLNLGPISDNVATCSRISSKWNKRKTAHACIVNSVNFGPQTVKNTNAVSSDPKREYLRK